MTKVILLLTKHLDHSVVIKIEVIFDRVRFFWLIFGASRAVVLLNPSPAKWVAVTP